MVEDNRSVLDMMCETITENHKLLAQTRDITYNVRAELVSLRSLPQETERLSAEIEELKKELKNLKENFKKPNLCLSCGNIVLPRFKVCPHCGENLHVTPEKAVKMLKTYTQPAVRNLCSHPPRLRSEPSKKPTETREN